SLPPTRSYLRTKAFAITVTWLLLMIFYGLSGGMTAAQAQTRAYVTMPCTSSVSVFDTSANTVITNIPLGAIPTGIAITPDGTRAYVTSGGGVFVINTATNTVIANIPINFPTSAVAITPDGARAYVTSPSRSSVLVIDTATNTVIATIMMGITPEQIAITPDGTRAY